MLISHTLTVEEETMKVNNIKCSLQSSKSIFDGELQQNKKYKTCIGNAILIVYGHSPLFINMTGLKSMEEIETTRKYIEFVYEVKCKDLRVDNIFYSFKGCQNIDINALYYYVRENFKEKFVTDFNVEIFPGLYMKSRIKGLPTLILFRTGSFTIIACKSIDQVKEYCAFVNDLFYHFSK